MENNEEKYQEIIRESNLLTEREKDIVDQYITNMFNRGVFDDEIQQTIITTEMILAIRSHRKTVYEEISDTMLNLSFHMGKIDSNKIVDSIGETTPELAVSPKKITQ